MKFPSYYHLVFTVISLLLGACATVSAPVPEAYWQGTVPDIAAEYQTTLETHGEADHPHNVAEDNSAHEPRAWRIWRRQDLFVRETLATGIADHWQKEGSALIQKKFFHHDQRGVEFQQADLQMLKKEPTWQQLVLLVDTQLIAALKEVDAGWRNGFPFRRYQGQAQNAEWAIDVRTDLMLPMRIERENAAIHETIVLVNAYPLASAPWQPTPVDNYNVIDFADIGDMAYDPFVKKVESLLGGVHHH